MLFAQSAGLHSKLPQESLSTIIYCATLLQLTTEQGMKAGLEADQAAKLAHIESLDAAAVAMRARLEQQTQQAEAAEGAAAAAQAEVTDHEIAMGGA